MSTASTPSNFTAGVYYRYTGQTWGLHPPNVRFREIPLGEWKEIQYITIYKRTPKMVYYSVNGLDRWRKKVFHGNFETSEYPYIDCFHIGDLNWEDYTQ